MSYLFTSESVSEGHPDKVADQISDAILDDFLRQDPNAKVACETFVSTGLVVIGGEVKSEDAYVDIQSVSRNVIEKIGYTKAEYMFDSKSCGILSALHEQSPDINRGVVQEEQGAGDQGMMFGYACDDTQEFMPLPVTLSHIALIELAKIRREENSPMPYLRPDAKSQFTIEYDDNHNPVRVHTFVLSTQHDDFVACEGGVIGSLENDKALHDRIYNDIKDILIPRILSRLPEKTQKLFDENLILHVNPTGKFVIGGPHGDTGLTGRKIIVDTYGGKGAHGGGAFSGKDPSKVDRSAAYMARYIAKNLVAAGVAKEILVQLSYAIGIAKPVSIYVNTYGTSTLTISDGEIAQKVGELFDLRPAKIIQKFGLNNPIYLPTAQYGHFGRDPFTRKCELIRNGEKIEKELQFFGWELLDSVELVKEAFTSVQKQG
ncbi:MAG: methionine adenosyltransferase [Bacteroidales bacterium]|jgi:S-adenosylmethionine synthetase|nr:methionine adenosyltransferase [Bacteroidales bacterium]